MDFIYKYFPNSEKRDCNDTRTDSFKIKDIANFRCVIYNINDELEHPYVTVINNNEKKIHFLALDNCILSHAVPTKRCDCILCDEMIVYFIEIKKAGSSKKQNVEEKKEESIEKLRRTIELFRQKNITEFANHTKECVLCVGCKAQIPKSYSSFKNYRAEFLMYYGSDLSEGSEIPF
jgi:hypothetical protein